MARRSADFLFIVLHFKQQPLIDILNTCTVYDTARQSRAAARQLSSTSASQRNLALSKMADSLALVKQQVLQMNVEEVAKARQEGQSAAMVKRLTIDDLSLIHN